MRGKTHMQIALATVNGIMSIPPIQSHIFGSDLESSLSSAFMIGISAMVGGLFADIDTETSTIAFFFPALASWIHKKAQTSKMFWHRRLFHSIVVFPLLCSMIAAYVYFAKKAILFYIFLGITFGWLSHSLSDYVVSEVALFAPFSNKKFSILHLEGNYAAQAKLDGLVRVIVTLWNIFVIGKGLYLHLPA